MVTVLKTVVSISGTVGSNPTPSAFFALLGSSERGGLIKYLEAT